MYKILHFRNEMMNAPAYRCAAAVRKRDPRALCCTTLVLVALQVGASDTPRVQFNPDFFADDNGQTLDLSRFTEGNVLTPGRYRFNLLVNQSFRGIDEVEVRVEENQPRYCFSAATAAALPIDITKLPDLQRQIDEDNPCIDLADMLPESQIAFEYATLTLDISIPHLWLKRDEENYAAPEVAQQGVMAAFIDYNANAWHSHTDNTSATRFYTGLNSGINIGPWRLRHNGSYAVAGGDNLSTSAKYSALNSYLQRDMAALKSQLTLGQFYTSAMLFDSFSYTGIQLSSDERMYPDSQRGFAPVIRGTAETNATVSVRQGSHLLYETSVAPGPFAIDNLHGGGYAGDIEVTVEEADGRKKSFTVPYATVPQLLRPGVSRYSLVLGEYRNDSMSDNPLFFQSAWQRGISNLWTGYAGTILASNYTAFMGGAALSTGAGAFAFDITHSRATNLDQEHYPAASSRGESYRLSYSKMLATTQTNFAVAAYCFSSKGYLSFTDFAQIRKDSGYRYATFRQRNRVQANISQRLGDTLGSLYLSGSIQDYWNSGRQRDMSYQAGYSHGFKSLSYNLALSRTHARSGGNETQLMLSFSLPLGTTRNTPYITNSLTAGRSGDWNLQSSLSGSGGLHNQLGYGIYAGHNKSAGDGASSMGANLQYYTPQADLSFNASLGKNYQQYGTSLSGSVVMHRGGVNFSQSQGETKAIVFAPGASGASLLNGNGIKIADNGYAVVSGLTPYRENALAVDPKGIADDIELTLTEQRTAPRYGAIVKVEYLTVRGDSLLLVLVLRDVNGEELPVGAEVLDSRGQSLTFVGQGSRVFLRVRQPEGEIIVRWGAGEGRQCRADYQLPATSTGHGSAFITVKSVCQAVK